MPDVDVVWELTRRESNAFRLKATHRRMGWVPETVDLLRLADPLRHELAARTWPAGTQETAPTMDRLGIPHDLGARRVRPLLRDAGWKGRNDVIAAAIRYRRGETS